MSGNPFRRAAAPPALDPASAGHDGTRFAGDDWPSADTQVPPPHPARTKKHVRLASPPSSPPGPSSPDADAQLAQRLSAARSSVSPPPPTALSDASSDDTADEPSEDSPASADEQDEDAPLKQSASAASAKMEAMSRTSGVPNPFQRTLASMEPGAQQSSTTAEGPAPDARGTADRSGLHKTKGSMDVDSFKRLLMTGSAAPAAPGASTTAGVQPRANITIVGDTSSGTDASSVSRNSLFESVLQAHEDSPRSSYERTSFDGGNDDDQSTLIGAARKPEKKKPPPPRHRHGKSINRAPQVVSFSDFSPSFSSPGTAKSEAPQRTPSDVHKPLPPRPRASSGPQNKELPSSPPAEPVPPKDIESPFEAAAAGDAQPVKPPEPPPQRRKPPTPPLSRRHSQLKSSAGSDSRSRSNSSATLSSQTEERSQEPATTSSSSHKAPPPPPARRSGGGSSLQSSTIDLGASRTSSRRSTASSMHNPNVVPRSHRLSGSALEMTSPAAAPVAAPPPPPPRRGSSKSSFDMPRPSASVLASAGLGGPGGSSAGGSPVDSRRTSMEFKGRSRTTSVASERVESYAPVDEIKVGSPSAADAGAGGRTASTGSGSMDLLSELDKLQQEVEALRQKSGKA